MTEIVHRLEQIGVVPMVAIERLDRALPLADALLAGGLPVAEITFRTDAAAEVTGPPARATARASHRCRHGFECRLPRPSGRRGQPSLWRRSWTHRWSPRRVSFAYRFTPGSWPRPLSMHVC